MQPDRTGDGLVEWLGVQLDADEHRAWPHMVVVSGGHPSPGVPNCIGPSGTGDCQSGWRLEPPEGAGPGWWKAPVVQEAMREHGLSHATAEQRWRLADIAAKRAILELHARRLHTHMFHQAGQVAGPVELWTCATCCDDRCPTWELGAGHRDPSLISCCQTIPLLALPHADREGWREEWRP